MDLVQWLDRYDDKLANNWEKMFVDRVLSSVADLDWLAVTAQMSFKDQDGGNRYADFAISEGAHVRIVIEIDGYDKRGRGTGMSHSEFQDWLRRQNALSDQGWSVLRFANRDVRDRPERCTEHIALLLRDQRHQMSHHESLHRSIIDLERELSAANETARQIGETKNTYHRRLDQEREKAKSAKRKQLRLQKELAKARREMQLAERSPALNADEVSRLAELSRTQQKTIEQLTGDNETMKTTIWAFAAVVISAMAMLVYVSTEKTNTPVSLPPEETSAIVVEPGTSCEAPMDWTRARAEVGRSLAVSGPIAGISYRPQSRGQPTWINIGADFPDTGRFVAVVWGRNREALAALINSLKVGDEICISGIVEEFDGVSQIEIEGSSQIERLY